MANPESKFDDSTSSGGWATSDYGDERSPAGIHSDWDSPVKTQPSGRVEPYWPVGGGVKLPNQRTGQYAPD